MSRTIVGVEAGFSHRPPFTKAYGVTAQMDVGILVVRYWRDSYSISCSLCSVEIHLRYFVMFNFSQIVAVSRAIISSSFVGTTNTFTRDLGE